MAVIESLVQKAEIDARERKQGKKAPLKKRTVEVKENDTLDIQHVVDAHIAGEIQSSKEMAAAVREMDEIVATPDFPPAKRWGNKGRLTIMSPGTVVEDPTYIPEYVETRSGFKRHIANHRTINGQNVVLTSDSQRKYRWCAKSPKKIALHKRRGYRFSSYKALFEDTDLLECVTGDIVQNGDLYLMEISLDGWESMVAERQRLQSALEGSYGNELFSQGQRFGVPTFKEDANRGVREYYT